MPILKHKRVLTALMTTCWAMHPAKLAQIEEFVAARLEGRITGKEFKQTMEEGQDQAAYDRPYEMRDGVAVISLAGVMTRRLNLFEAISGGMSTQQVSRRIAQAGADAAVRGIVLDIDSPGGTVFTVDELTDAVRAAREYKPVVAFSYGMCCSAAYWVAAQCDHVMVSDASESGSIGVAYVHYDLSKRDEMEGVTRTVMSAGKYKRIAHDAAPLSQEGADYIQEMLDTYYTLFVDAVAKGRGVDVETVLERMADGRTFIGKEAVVAGLADSIGTLSEALALARGERRERMPMQQAPQSPAPAGADGKGMRDAGQDVTAQMESANAQARAEGEQAGMAAERARVLAVLDADVDADIARAVIKEGVPAAEAYERQLKADRSARAEVQKEIQEALDEHAPAAGTDNGKQDKDFMALARARAQADGIGITQAMRMVAKENPELHAAWVDSQQRA